MDYAIILGGNWISSYEYGKGVTTEINAGKNSNLSQIRIGQIGQCQNLDKKLMTDTLFFQVGQFGRIQIQVKIGFKQ